MIKIVEEIVKVLRNNKWQLEKGLALEEEKVYIPQINNLRLEEIHGSQK